MIPRVTAALVLSSASAVWLHSCTPTQPNGLDKLGTVRLSIKGQPFELWVADTEAERERGLMFVTAAEMADLPNGTKRGMLFIFDHESYLTFWMKNTIIPLDIVYLDSNGKVVATHTMLPLDTRLGQYPSGSPARYAIEVNANVFTDLGVKAGDRIEIPTSALKDLP